MKRNPIGRTAAVAAFALLAVSCASAPPAADPISEVEIPEEWSTRPPAEAAAADGDPWWKSFGDARLEELVDEALERNHDLKAAAAAVEAALAQARIAGAALKPGLDAALGTSTQQQVFVGLPIPGSTGPLRTSFDSFDLGVDVSWEADLWGRLGASRQAAASGVEAARADYAGARLSLAAQAARAWFTLLEARRQVELALQTLKSRRVTTERATARYRRGVGEPIDVRLARSNEARAESVLELRRRQLDAAKRRLEILLGRYPAGRLETAADLPAVPDAPAAPMPAELVTRRPDLVAAERRLEAAGWRVAEARRALYPRLRFAAGGGTTSDSVGDLLDSDFSVWHLAGGLLQPLFQGGRLRATVEFSEASRERALAEYVVAALRAFAEVETALAAEGLLAAEESALARGAEEAAAAVELAEDRYVAGVGDYLAILESQRQAFAAESRLLAVRRLRLTNRVDLYAALGGDV